MVDLFILDNVDSFTYNLVHLCHRVIQRGAGQQGRIMVARPTEITLNDIAQTNPTAILISPGPGAPEEARMAQDVIAHFASQTPIFGVCLGMQAMAQCYGAQVVRGVPVHGKKAPVYHPADHPLFEGIPSPFQAVRYHSLQVAAGSISPSAIRPLAQTGDGVIMALEIVDVPLVWGVQFHPESIGSAYGEQLLENFYMAASRLASGFSGKSAASSFSRQ